MGRLPAFLDPNSQPFLRRLKADVKEENWPIIGFEFPLPGFGVLLALGADGRRWLNFLEAYCLTKRQLVVFGKFQILHPLSEDPE